MPSTNVHALERFLMLFDAVRVEIDEEADNEIFAHLIFPRTLSWEEPKDLHQDVCWTIQSDLDDALDLAEAVKDAGHLNSDRIDLSFVEIMQLAQDQLRWSSMRCKTALDRLLSIRVDMVDGGEKSDYFFIHL